MIKCVCFFSFSYSPKPTNNLLAIEYDMKLKFDPRNRVRIAAEKKRILFSGGLR